MTFISLRSAIVGTALLLATSQTFAQAQGDVPVGISSPAYSLTDPNGINLTSNKPTFRITDVSIGDKKTAMSHTFFSVYDQPSNPAVLFSDSFAGRVQTANVADPSSCPSSGSLALDVIIAGAGDTMCSTVVNNWYPMRKGGTSMVRNGDGTLTYTSKDGLKYLFGIMVGANYGVLTQVTNPDGKITTLTYRTGTVGSTAYRRVQSVTRSDGLQMKYTYVDNALPSSGYPQQWLRVASVTAINNTIDYCDPSADSCTYSQTWPSTTHTWTTGAPKYFTITDQGGQATRLTIGIPVLTPGEAPGVVFGTGWTNYISDQLLAVRAPTSTSADTTIYRFCAVWGEYVCMKGGVKKVISNGAEWLYPGTSGSGGPSLFIQLTVSRPASIGGGWTTTTQSGNNASGPMISHFDGIAKRTFGFEQGHANRVANVQSVDGDILSYVYDQRGNITQETHTPKSGSSLAPLVKTANFDTTCANPVTCNKPNWTKDARLKQTDFVYDPIHGGILKVTSPSDVNGIRPQVRYGYAQRYAWYKNSSGSVVQAAAPIWLPSTQKYCRKTAALADGTGCTGGATDEVTTTFEYGPTSGANNLFPRGMSVTSEGVTLRACYAHDIYGNRISETLPKAGLSSCP
jgi:YD repeat-containing protein